MEDEKRYPILDEEDGMTLMAAEPVAGAALAYAPSYLDEENLPLIGPATYEEAIERIELAEREPYHKGVTWEVVKRQMLDRINSYAG